ncbi:hypothetical protein [Caballeronia sp. BR00000012568055]|uniref:hypothetical protein n=1 Tax=Caballeronia sp. BR00000012568055 TaxID=2918761 RepID=UPI0023F7302F|nr:hypothetical protein [Caballeronia sp. BR00000012568055]
MSDELLNRLHQAQFRYEGDPNDLAAIRDICETLIALEHEEAVLPWATRGLALSPHDQLLLLQRHAALNLVGAHAEAVESLLRLPARPWHPAFYALTLGYSLMMAGDLARAIPQLDEARRLATQSHAALVATATQYYGEAWLKAGDGGGFAHWTWRNQSEGAGGSYRPAHIPQWDGQSDVRGKRVLITHQLGFGDQFLLGACMAQWLAAGAAVMLTCDLQIHRLMQASLPDCRVVSAPRPLAANAALPDELLADIEDFAPDLHAPLLFAPLLANSAGTPGRPFVPYLRSPEEKRDIAARWSQQLRAKHPGKKLVGLFWDCEQRHHVELGSQMRCWAARRSIPLAQIDLLTQDPSVSERVHFVNLHHPLLESQAGVPAGNVSVYAPGIYHFDDTAACIEQLDAVVSVDSGVSNCAAMIGKLTCVPVNTSGDWRWGLTGTSSPWIANATVFRQRQEGDWQPVMRDVATWLTQAV